MKLEQALKMYLGLYILSFCLTWFVSIPMLIHVAPLSECLLFITPQLQYGPASNCQFVGITAVICSLLAIFLIAIHVRKLISLRRHLKESRRSDDYDGTSSKSFWRIVMLHGVTNLLILAIAAVVTTGYISTCQHLHREVRYSLHKRIQIGRYGNQNTRKYEDLFADDQSIHHYIGEGRDVYGDNFYPKQISCRHVLTDPLNHLKLKRNTALNPEYHISVGYYSGSDPYTDRGNLHSDSYHDNLNLEMTMAGSWILFTVWTFTMILLTVKRHHIKTPLTDESSWESQSRLSKRTLSSQMSRPPPEENQRNVPPHIEVSKPPPESELNYFQNDFVDVDEAINEYVPKQDIELCQSFEEEQLQPDRVVGRRAYRTDLHQYKTSMGNHSMI